MRKVKRNVAEGKEGGQKYPTRRGRASNLTKEAKRTTIIYLNK